MSTRTRHRWLAWLLPLMLLRAFVPAGFMLSWADAGLQVVLCSGVAPLPLQAASVQAHQSHAHHEQADDPAAQVPSKHEHPQNQAHDASMCPFVGAGSAHAPLRVIALADPVLLPMGKIDFTADPELRSASHFIDRIRGPPSV